MNEQDARELHELIEQYLMAQQAKHEADRAAHAAASACALAAKKAGDGFRRMIGANQSFISHGRAWYVDDGALHSIVIAGPESP